MFGARNRLLVTVYASSYCEAVRYNKGAAGRTLILGPAKTPLRGGASNPFDEGIVSRGHRFAGLSLSSGWRDPLFREEPPCGSSTSLPSPILFSCVLFSFCSPSPSWPAPAALSLRQALVGQAGLVALVARRVQEARRVLPVVPARPPRGGLVLRATGQEQVRPPASRPLHGA